MSNTGLDSKALAKKMAREAKARKEEEERQAKILRGRDGGGDKDNYETYCRRCRVEYVVPVATCTRCGKNTIKKEERRAELLGMVDQYKEAKKRKQDRKQKWDMWKKTQAMFWKKTATNYEKWEYFTDSEDEFEAMEKNAPPVLPDNDPNFMAMKSDLEQRAANRKARAKEANELKLKGNELMKKKFYDRAVQVYSEGIEIFRNNKYLWTNRALAHLKRNDFQLAIDDCTKMLEYAEVLENGYTESQDANFKFFARRAMGYLGLKKPELALKDIDEALKLYPDDKAAQETRKEILEKIESAKKLETLDQKLAESDLTKNFSEGQLQTKAEVDSFFTMCSDMEANREAITAFDYFKLKDLWSDKDLKLYFFKRKGLDLLKKILKKNFYKVTHGESEKGKLNFLTFLKCLGEEDALYAEGMVENMIVRNVIKKLLQDLAEIFPNNTEKQENADAAEVEGTGAGKSQKSAQDTIEENIPEAEKPTLLTSSDAPKVEDIYDFKVIQIEDFLEFLITLTENRTVRAYLRDKPHLLIPAFKIIQENFAPRFEKEYSVLSSAISFFSNLCMTDVGIKNAEIREHFLQNHLQWIYSFSAKVLLKPQNKFLCLKNSCLAFAVNLSTDKVFREHTISRILTFEGLHKDRSATVAATDFNYIAYFMQNLGIAFRAIYNKASEPSMKEHQGLVTRFYEQSTGLLLNLFFQLTDKSTVAHMQNHFRRWHLDLVCVDILHACFKLRLNMGILLNRFVNVVAKLGFESTPENNEKMLYVMCELANLFDEDTSKNREFFTDAIRFFAALLQEKKDIGKTAIELTLATARGFNAHIRSILSSETGNIMR